MTRRGSGAAAAVAVLGALVGAMAIVLVAVIGAYLYASTPRSTTVTTTAWDARRLLVTHLQTLVDTQSAGTVFSDRLPENPPAVLGSGQLPADENHSDPDQAYTFSLDYWVLSPTTTEVTPTTGYERLVAAMRALGWSVGEDAPGFAVGTIDDGYTVVVRASAGRVTVGAQSPTFPRSQIDRRAEWPSRLMSTTD